MNLYQLRFMGRRGPLADYIDLPNFVAIGSGGGVKIRHFQLTWPVAVSSGTILRTAQPVTTLTATSFNQNLCSLQRLAK